MKNIRIFHLKIFIFLLVKFSVYLNRRVFVMISIDILSQFFINKHMLWVLIRCTLQRIIYKEDNVARSKPNEG